jgi:NADPH:quinone reductase-like Zn-dependent oxidoreductase
MPLEGPPRSESINVKAIQLNTFGDPADVVRLVDVPELDAPAADEIIIAPEASPINNTDLMIITGRYGYLPPLPTILGVEGVGRVAAVGRDVKNLKEGDRTLIPVLQPTWAERIKVRADWLRPLPDGDVDQFSMIGINVATAYLMLTDIVTLKKGDWLIQNGASSPTGRTVIAIAKSLGLKTVNIVRRPEMVDEITALGGDLVLVDGPEASTLVRTELGKTPINYALDMVGDSATMTLMDSMAPGGVLTSYSVASLKPLNVNGLKLIFANQSVRGFWIMNWLKTASPQQLTEMYGHLASMVAGGEISAPIAATYTFEQYADALAAAATRRSKIIFRPTIAI